MTRAGVLSSPMSDLMRHNLVWLAAGFVFQIIAAANGFLIAVLWFDVQVCKDVGNG